MAILRIRISLLSRLKSKHRCQNPVELVKPKVKKRVNSLFSPKVINFRNYEGWKNALIMNNWYLIMSKLINNKKYSLNFWNLIKDCIKIARNNDSWSCYSLFIIGARSRERGSASFCSSIDNKDFRVWLINPGKSHKGKRKPQQLHYKGGILFH